MELKSELAGRFLQVLRGGLGIFRICGIDEQGKGRGRRNDLMEQFKAFRTHLCVQRRYPGDVATWSIQVDD